MSNPYGGWPPPGYVHPTPPPPALSGESSVEYHLIQRTGAWGDHGWWRPIVGTVAVTVGFFLVPAFLAIFFVLALVAGGEGVEDALDRVTNTDDVTPLVLAFLNVSLAAAIPLCMIVTRVLHGLTPGWLASVRPRIRWTWLLVTFGLAFVALVATVLVSILLPATADSGDVGGDLNSWTSTTRDFLLVIVLLTPLQAAGEEYVFRGYLAQSFGGLLAPLGPWASRAAAVLVPAVLFALAHGAQDAPVFVDRLAFGLVAGVLVITTGGLEAGIAMHVLNNFLAYGFALAYSDMTSALNPTGGSWWQLPVTLTQSLTYLALATWAARRLGIATTTTPAGTSTTGPVLEAPERRV